MKWIAKRLHGRKDSLDLHVPKRLVRELDLRDCQYFLFEAQKDGAILITPFRRLEEKVEDIKRDLCQK